MVRPWSAIEGTNWNDMLMRDRAGEPIGFDDRPLDRSKRASTFQPRHSWPDQPPASENQPVQTQHPRSSIEYARFRVNASTAGPGLAGRRRHGMA